MAVHAGINGFGCTGRNFFHAVFKQGADIEIAGISNLTGNRTLSHLLKYDSVTGRLGKETSYDGKSIMANGRDFAAMAEHGLANLSWGDLGVDIVIKFIDFFTDGDVVRVHVKAGARKVIISAPARGNVDAIFVVNVNHTNHDPAKHDAASNASCATNCLVPMTEVLDDVFGIECGLVATIHTYTRDQHIYNASCKDLRRARAAVQNIVPIFTGAAYAVALTLPQLKGKPDGYALHVPVITGSVIDFSFIPKKFAFVEEVNAMMGAAAEDALRSALDHSDKGAVFTDIVTDSHSSISDVPLTKKVDNTTKRVSWHDNEWGYSNRMVDLTEFTGKQLQALKS